MEASEIVKITELYVDAGKYATEKLIAIAIRVQIVSQCSKFAAGLD